MNRYARLQLLQEWRATGDEVAFAILLRDMRGLFMKVARRYDVADRDELWSEMYFTFYKACIGYRGINGAQLSTYVYKALDNAGKAVAAKEQRQFYAVKEYRHVPQPDEIVQERERVRIQRQLFADALGQSSERTAAIVQTFIRKDKGYGRTPSFRSIGEEVGGLPRVTVSRDLARFARHVVALTEIRGHDGVWGVSCG